MKKLLVCIVCILALGGISFAADISTALDPMYLGVGARPLGMGRSYVAVAEDADALLLNPAGLGRLDGVRQGLARGIDGRRGDRGIDCYGLARIGRTEKSIHSYLYIFYAEKIAT